MEQYDKSYEEVPLKDIPHLLLPFTLLIAVHMASEELYSWMITGGLLRSMIA